MIPAAPDSAMNAAIPTTSMGWRSTRSNLAGSV
jgi:hypothetical protein